MAPASGYKSARTFAKNAVFKMKDEVIGVLKHFNKLQTVKLENLEQHKNEVGVTIGKLESKLDKFDRQDEKLEKFFNDTDDEVSLSDLNKEREQEGEAVEEFRDQLIKLQKHAEDIQNRIQDMKPKVEATATPAQKSLTQQEMMDQMIAGMGAIFQAQNQQQQAAAAAPPPLKVKLPKFEIQKFKGDIMEWSGFWAQFKSAVHEVANLQDIDKFQLLRSHLAGDALETIKGYEFTPANYAHVVTALEQRFGRSQLIIETHFNELFNLSSTTSDSIKLRKFYDTMQKYLRTLEGLGQDVNTMAILTCMKSKLPQDVITQMEFLKPRATAWTMQLFRQYLREAIELSESVSYSKKITKNNTNSDSSSGSGARPKQNQSEKPKSTAQALVVSEQTPRNKYCAFCQKTNHYSDECQKFATTQTRINKLKEDKKCNKCLRTYHKDTPCNRQARCFHCKAVNNHHSSLCYEKFGKPTTNKQDVKRGKKPKTEKSFRAEADEGDEESSPQNDQLTEHGKIILNKCTESSLLSRRNHSTAMQTAWATIRDPNRSKETRVHLMFDIGTNRTYILKRVAKQIQLPNEQESVIQIHNFGSTEPQPTKCYETRLQIKLNDGSFMEIDASVVDHISEPTHRAPYGHVIPQEVVDNYKLADTIPNQMETSDIELLIGEDYYFDFLCKRRKTIGPGLYLQNSKLGWIVAGRFPSKHPKTITEQSVACFVHSYIKEEPESTFLTTEEFSKQPDPPNLDLFHKLEVLGIEKPSPQTDEENATEQFKQTVKVVNNRFEVAWPWKVEDPDLPSNYSLTYNRFRSVAKRLEANPELLKKYDEIIQNQIKLGIIEPVTPSTVEGPLKHYVPHHPVESPTSTYTKVRIVYDASAKSKKDNLSLNDCLYAGSNLIQDLCGLHIRFRLWQIAIIADIEKAFLNIGLQIPDRDVTRFFWFKDPTNPKVEGNIQVYRFCRIPFGVTSSPFLLASTINYLMETHQSPVAQQLKDNIYVDNVLTGANNVDEALKLYQESQIIFKSVSLNLREWSSNSTEFMEQIPAIHRAEGCTFKVLGINWNTTTDSLTIAGYGNSKFQHISTKREVLQAVASVYDPLGYFSPVTLVAKNFLHSLWDRNYGWDDKLPSNNSTEWQEIYEQLATISQHSIPRYIQHCNQPETTYQLLCFCDASIEAYATVIYLRVSNGTDHHISLLFSKTRLAPPKKLLSIPRMELMAAVVGHRSLNFVHDQVKLPLTKKILWSDSKCVLHWIRNSKKTLSVFVENRVKEIRKTEDITYRYVKTTSNPADMASRGCTVNELNESFWWNGPSWLTQPTSSWPDWDMEEFDQTIMDAIEAETQKNQPMYTVGLLVGEGPSEEEIQTPFGIQQTKYSSRNKLLRITAYISRFVTKLMAKCGMMQHNSVHLKPFERLEEVYHQHNEMLPKCWLLTQEINEARFLWDKALQQHWYANVYQAIADGSKNNIVSQLGVRVDDFGLLRCHGRFQNATLTEAARKPKLLPSKDHVTKLIVEHVHKTSLHIGVSQTLSLLRQEYWLPTGGQRIRSILSDCRHCKKLMGGPFRLPAMAPWPKERMTQSPPFTVTGLDYFGPLYVKDRSDTQDRKVWVCLFTCVATRAVHLELIEDMTTNQFLMCFRRFVGHHGKPNQIISDNATQLKLANSTIDKAWDDVVCNPEIQNYASTSGIKWKFITEFAPWTGGFYERMVGIVKTSMRKAIGIGFLSTMQLSTLLVEVQAIVNTRPLVYINDDINSEIALTPAHFLGLNPRIGIPQINSNADESDPDYNEQPESSAETLLQAWKKGHKHLERFWKTWRDDYLLSLRKWTKTHVTQGRIQSKNQPKPGDIILIKDNLPRGSWKMGKIQSLITSRDGAVRAATVLLPNQRTINRPINLLYPIECPIVQPVLATQNNANSVPANDEPEQPVSQGVQLETTSSNGVQSETISSRPKRSAAIRGRELVQSWVRDIVGLMLVHRDPETSQQIVNPSDIDQDKCYFVSSQVDCY